MDFPGLPELLSVLLGALSTIVVQFLKQRVPSRNWRFSIALLLSGGLGALVAWTQDIPVQDLPAFAGYAFAASQAVYQYFKGLFQDSK